ncbi:hypothetical protein Hanom_Chr12g01153461 [Helianthus anomalus]
MLAVELSPANNHRHSASPQASLFRTSALAVGEILEKCSLEDSVSCVSKYQIPKIDKSGRFCSPRAARELALYVHFTSNSCDFIEFYLCIVLYTK